LSKITIYYLGSCSAGNIQRLGNDLGYTIAIHEEGSGKLRFSTTPNLTAAHKTILQKIIDAIGYGKIT